MDAVLTIQQENQPIDLHMVEIMEMMHKTETDTMWVTADVFQQYAGVRFMR